MAGIGESEKSLSAARTLLADMETTMSRVEKRTAALNAIKFSEQISEGNTSLKETEEIYRRLGDDVDAVSAELLEIVERTEKTKAATIEWADQLDNVSKNLLGISLPALTVNGLLKAAVGTTIDWYNHTFKIERKLYDVGAALGEAGTRSVEFEDIISKTALAFHAQSEEVRGVVDGLADMGANSSDIKDILDDVIGLTRIWSDVTPEKQMSLMSDYMKEFGMNGKEAWATMNALYVTSQDLRKDLPNLDIQKFVDQTQSVAISMRSYGLEAQDAIALTSTLARLGVEQARIPEIAKRMGGIGLEQAPETVFMAQRYMLPELQRQQAAAITGRGGAGPASPEEMEERAGKISLLKAGPVGAMGVMAMATGRERTGAQMGMLEDMLGQIGVKLTDPLEKLVGGLTLVDLPGIGKMGIEEAKEFGKAVQKLKEEGVTPAEAIQETLRKTTEATETATEKAKEDRAEQIKVAEKVATATVTTADKMQAVADNTKAILMFLQGPTDYANMTPEEARTAEKAKLLKAAGGYEPRREFKTAKEYRSEEEYREATATTPEMGPTISSTISGAQQFELIINPTTSQLLLQAVENGEAIAPVVDQLKRKTGM